MPAVFNRRIDSTTHHRWGGCLSSLVGYAAAAAAVPALSPAGALSLHATLSVARKRDGCGTDDGGEDE